MKRKWIVVVLAAVLVMCSVGVVIGNIMERTRLAAVAAPRPRPAQQKVAVAPPSAELLHRLESRLFPFCWVNREPGKPVLLHRFGFSEDEGPNGLIYVVLDLGYDPRRFTDPARDLRFWAEGAISLLAYDACPYDVRVSFWTILPQDEVLSWCHARFWATGERITFEEGPAWGLLEQ